MKNSIIDFLLMCIVIGIFLYLVLSGHQPHSYLVKRIDNNLLQRYEFKKVQTKGDTVIIYDEIPGADGPIFLPTKAIIQDTIL